MSQVQTRSNLKRGNNASGSGTITGTVPADHDFQQLKFTTDIPNECSNVVWELKNFKALTEIKDSLKLLKLNFEAGHTMGVPTKWCFFMRRDGEQLGVFLELKEAPKGVKQVFARYKTVIKRQDGTNFLRLVTEATDMKACADWGWTDIGSPTTLVASKTNVLVNGSLIINFAFEMFAHNTTITGGELNDIKRLRASSQAAVADDMLQLLNTGMHSDVIIKTKDLQTFNVHRSVLGARSTVFQAMFKSKMIECTNKTVEIEDISSDAMVVVLRYIYSGTIEDDWIPVAEEIVYAADKYNLTILKNFCDKALINACTNDTALDFLKLAKLHGLETAVKDIMQYIKLHIGLVLMASP